MNFDLCTIDWTAIGSIVTFIAMIIAYWTIHSSNKQNESNQKFQLLLMQREIEQKRLDELVESILAINDSIQAVDVLDYTRLLLEGKFTESDQKTINTIAAKDKSDSNKLTICLTKYNKNNEAKKVLESLSLLRNKYGEWIRRISCLYLYKRTSPIPASVLKLFIESLEKQLLVLDSELESGIKEIVSACPRYMDQAIELMNVYSSTVSDDIILDKISFEKELVAFVKNEQERIDNIIAR